MSSLWLSRYHGASVANRPDLYIDIDGVLIGKDDDGFPAIAPHAEEFLRTVRGGFQCWWLSSYTRSGTEASVRSVFSQHAKGLLLDTLCSIPARRWAATKFEGIDLERSFLWVDDDPVPQDRAALSRRGLLERWIHVNTKRDPDGLLNALREIEIRANALP